MKKIEQKAEGMCVPYAISFLTGLPISESIRQLGQQRQRSEGTSRIKLGWSAFHYFPVMGSNNVKLGDIKNFSENVKNRINTIFYFNPNMKTGTWLLLVTGHICVLHNGLVYHNQAPKGEAPKDVKTNYRLQSAWPVLSPVAAHIPYEEVQRKEINTDIQNVSIKKFDGNLMNYGTGWYVATCDMGGRHIDVVARNGKYLTFRVNGRVQQSCSGSVRHAINYLINKICEIEKGV